MEKRIDFECYLLKKALKVLLKDKSAKKILYGLQIQSEWSTQIEARSRYIRLYLRRTRSNQESARFQKNNRNVPKRKGYHWKSGMLMVDMLEKENPGCFDDSEKTFIDPYMKSGMYITEIVKRLYQSETMKRLYPESEVRLQHIFEKQVYGLAPTEIIYRIALSYILGFAKENTIMKHNF